MLVRLDHTAVAAQVPALLRTLAGPAGDPHLDIEGVPDPNTSPGSTPTHPA